MNRLVMFLKENKLNVREFVGVDNIYEKVIKEKNKQGNITNEVLLEFVNSQTFFNILVDKGIKNNEKWH